MPLLRNATLTDANGTVLQRVLTGNVDPGILQITNANGTTVAAVVKGAQYTVTEGNQIWQVTYRSFGRRELTFSIP
jgi:hypothetical protein